MQEATKYLEYARLIARYISGDLSDKELTKLENWKFGSRENAKLFDRILDEQNRIANQVKMQAVDTGSAWNLINKAISQKPSKRILFQKALRYAAVFILILTSAASVYYVVQENKKMSIKGMGTAEIIPGSPKAILTLANGLKIDLEDKENFLLEEKGGVLIHNKNFTINYNDSTILNTKEENLIHEITTPRGGEFTVVLSDGSKIHVNSMSTLRYPVKLSGDKRNVELVNGEAFFEVVENKNKPFIIKTKNATLSVLGTSFNVNTYDEVSHSLITLETGILKVNNVNVSGDEVILKPGQQASIDKSVIDYIDVKEVDASIYSSWRKGTFAFKDERLDVIMQTLARWYNIEVFFEYESLKDLEFAGNINKYSSIDPIIEILRLTKKIKIEMDKNYILITKN
jgi:ferric-dicitrate binding protein FerR (iron transport regulator)